MGRPTSRLREEFHCHRIQSTVAQERRQLVSYPVIQHSTHGTQLSCFQTNLLHLYLQTLEPNNNKTTLEHLHTAHKIHYNWTHFEQKIYEFFIQINFEIETEKKNSGYASRRHFTFTKIETTQMLGFRIFQKKMGCVWKWTKFFLHQKDKRKSLDRFEECYRIFLWFVSLNCV